MTTFVPDFNQLLKVLHCEKPDRPVLFELFMNMPLYERFAGHSVDSNDVLGYMKTEIDGFIGAGYDYATVSGSNFGFNRGSRPSKKTISLNDSSLIYDRESYEKYVWNDPDAYDYSHLEKIKPYLPENFKLMVMGPGGVLENVTRIVGYDNLCLMLYDDEDLAAEIFNQVGSRLLKYYQNSVGYDSVGLLMSNDDWGFNTQTFLTVEQMRKYVFPWHKKYVEVAHNADKPIVLHSCGNASEIMEDIIEDMGYDGKHSFEDNICPIEETYKQYGGRIALLGGIDIDFLTRSDEKAISERCEKMLKLAESKGGYALGSGNSIPEFIPYEKYYAMINEAYKLR